jgi:hypothetical protein
VSRRTDLGAILAGVTIAGVGVVALVLGADALASSLKWIWPGVLIGIGAFLLASRPCDRSGSAGSSGKHGSSHQVGAERSEDGEVEQPRRRHHG